MTSLQKMQIDDWRGFRGFLECCFAQRRRLLANSLKIAGISPDRLARLPEILGALGLGADARAELLEKEQFLTIYQQLLA